MNAPTESPLITFDGVNKWYGEFHVLRDINLNVAKGERIVICGPSGSGKSTLLNIIGTLDQPTAGRVWLGGQDLSQLGGVSGDHDLVAAIFDLIDLVLHAR